MGEPIEKMLHNKKEHQIFSFSRGFNFPVFCPFGTHYYLQVHVEHHADLRKHTVTFGYCATSVRSTL